MIDKGKVLKIVTYSLVFFLLGIGVYFYLQYLQQKNIQLNQDTETILSKGYADKKVESDVLRDKKFKDLKKVEIDEEFFQDENQIKAEMTAEEIARIPRKKSNPFRPF